MEFYRGHVVSKRRAIAGWPSAPSRSLRMWDVKAMVAAFLLGFIIGIALGSVARALRVPGFVKYSVLKIAVDDCSRAVAIASVAEGTTAIPAGGLRSLIGGGAAGGASLPAAHKGVAGKHG